MFGLKTIFVAATAALAGFAAAAPTPMGSSLVARTECGCHKVSDVFVKLQADIKASVDVCVDAHVTGILDVSVALKAIVDVSAAIDVAISDIKILIDIPGAIDVTIEALVKLVVAVFVSLFVWVKAVIDIKVLGLIDISIHLTAVIIAKIQLFLDVVLLLAIRIDSHCDIVALKAYILACIRADVAICAQIRVFIHLQIDLILRTCGLLSIPLSL